MYRHKLIFPQSFPTIHTERLILKQATIEDAEDMHIYLSNETVCRYMGIDAHETIEDTKEKSSGITTSSKNKQASAGAFL